MISYRVPFKYSRQGEIIIEAENEKTAAIYAKKEIKQMSLAKMECISDFITDSETVCESAIKAV